MRAPPPPDAYGAVYTEQGFRGQRHRKCECPVPCQSYFDCENPFHRGDPSTPFCNGAADQEPGWCDTCFAREYATEEEEAIMATKTKKKATKKTAAKVKARGPGRTAFDVTPALAKAWIAKYAKARGISVAAATQHVLIKGVTRQMSLEIYGKATGKKAAKPKTKSAKPAAGKVAKKKPAPKARPKAAKLKPVKTIAQSMADT